MVPFAADSYLARLTLRLGEGVGRLDEPLRRRTAAAFRQAQNADGGFSGRQSGSSDLYYTGFALRGLAVLGELEGEVATRAAEFLRARSKAPASVVDFLSLIYGTVLIESACGIVAFADVAADWRLEVGNALEQLRRDDGGYAKGSEGHSSSTYYSFLVVLCRELLGLPPIEPERLVAFVQSRRQPDGGFVEIAPMKRSGTNPTAAAIGLLKALGRLDTETSEGAIDFLASMQSDEGGLRANTRIPIADVLSTFTGLWTLADLDALSACYLAEAARFIRELELPSGGFRAALWDGEHDVEYTFYGLGGLALLADH